jgi:PmbA protein
MAKYTKFFALAKEKGLEALELYVSRKYALSFSLFHGEVDSYSLEDAQGLSARGIYNGKIGYANTEKFDKSTASFVVDRVIDTAKAVDKDDPAILFPGSPKYRRANVYNPDIRLLAVDRKLAHLHEIEKKLKDADPRIVEVEAVSYSESEEAVELLNSYGLNLKNKSNYFYYYASVLVKDGEAMRSAYKIHLSKDPGDFVIDKFVKTIVDEALGKIGASSLPSKKYPVILAPRVGASLLEAYLSGASAEEVQKKSSLLAGKLHQLVASKKLSVIEAPLTKNCFFRYFDDEGVATYNKPIIAKGMLETYFYNLLTAHKDGTKTTGNGYRYGGGKISTHYVNLVIKPGRKSQEELIAKLKEGLLIQEVQGLHSGLNPQSGNFSLQASGFLIENGKISRPVNLITVAGNLKDLFLDVVEVGSDSELQLSSVTAPSLLIKKLAIAGQ